MYIQWLGHSCFKIQDKTGPDGVTIVTDPFDKSIGLKVPGFEADIVTVSHDHHDHNNVGALRGTPYVVKSAGEYDIKDVTIVGVDSFHDEKSGKDRGANVIFRFGLEGISIVHLGDLGHPLDNKQMELMAGTDILMIPVGGKYTLDFKQAVEVVGQVEPRIIIPMHYMVPGLKLDIDPADKFIKEIGLKPREEEKLKIAKKDLPAEDMELVILKL